MPFPLDSERPDEHKRDEHIEDDAVASQASEPGSQHAKEDNEDTIRMPSIEKNAPKNQTTRQGEGTALTNQEASNAARSMSREDRRKRLLEKEKQQDADTSENKEKQGSNQKEEQEQSREAKRKKARREKKRLKVRVVPIWLRLLIIIILCAAALVGGAMIGYGIIGKGNPMDVFNRHTWTHIRDIIYAKQ